MITIIPAHAEQEEAREQCRRHRRGQDDRAEGAEDEVPQPVEQRAGARAGNLRPVAQAEDLVRRASVFYTLTVSKSVSYIYRRIARSCASLHPNSSRRDSIDRHQNLAH